MIRVHVLLPQTQIDALSAMGELDRSEHIRRAIDEYIEKRRRSSASSSSVRSIRS